MSTPSPYVVAQLAGLCKAHRLEPKLALVPSLQAGYNLTGWLARQGTDWVNLRIETPLSLAAKHAEATLLSRGMRRLSADEDLFIVNGLVEKALSNRSEPRGFAASLTAGPGLSRSLQRSFVDLRLAGVDPSSLRSRRAAGSRISFVQELYAEYCALLSERRLFDGAELYRLAYNVYEELPARRAYGVVVVFDEVALPALAYRLVDRVIQRSEVSARVGRTDFEVDPPAHSAARRLHETPLFPAAEARVHPSGEIRRTGLRPEDAEFVQVRDAVGADSEIRGVLREIRARNLALDDVEIIYTSASPYVALIREAADAMSLPVSFGEGVPLHLTRPGKAVLGFYRWIASGMEASVLAHLLRSRLIRPPRKKGRAAVYAADLAEVLETQRATRGADEHLAAFDRKSARVRFDAQDGFGHNADQQLERLQDQRDSMKSLLGFAPKKDTATAGRLCRAGLRFLRRCFSPGDDADRRALDSIVDRLGDLAKVGNTASTESVAALIEDLLMRHRTEISVAREGHLYAVPVERAGYAGRPHVFVVGLDEGSFPGAATESPLLLDADLQSISSELEQSSGRPGARTWSLLRALGTVPRVVTLVANRFDVVDGRERYASSIHAQCRDDLELDPPIRYSASFAPEQALNETEAWLSQRRRGGYQDAVARRFPELERGRTATLLRTASGLSRFTGYLGRPAPELSLRAEAVLSPSRLERLVACPYQYFLNDVLRVRAPDEVDPEDTRWLNHKEFGKHFHQLLYDFMRAVKARGESVSLESHREEIHELTEQRAREIAERIPPPTQLAFEVDLRRMKIAAEVFLAAEETMPTGHEAIEFELKFGTEKDGARYPKPVRLDLIDGVTIRLRGSIDRVDRTPDGFTIWDYKTGFAKGFDRTDLIRSGKLQWALYAYAFRKLMDGLPTHLDVKRSGYYFASDRENGRRIWSEVPSEDVVGRYLRPLLEMSEQGAFFHFQKSSKEDSPCRYCDFKSVCAKERRDERSVTEAVTSTEGMYNVMSHLEEWMRL